MAEPFREAVEVVEDYLGPAAERFVRRQVDFHLEKPAEELTLPEVKQLAEWVRTSLGMLTQDKKLVSECVSRLQKVSKSS